MPITRWVERIKWLKKGPNMAKVYDVPLKVLRVTSAKFLTPDHETISIIDDQGNHQVLQRNQSRAEFDLITQYVKEIEPFARPVPPAPVEAPVEVSPPTPAPEPVPVAPAAEPAPVPVEPVAEAPPTVSVEPQPIEAPKEPEPMIEPAPQPAPEAQPDPGTPEAALQQAQELLQEPPVEPAPEAPKTE